MDGLGIIPMSRITPDTVMLYRLRFTTPQPAVGGARCVGDHVRSWQLMRRQPPGRARALAMRTDRLRATTAPSFRRCRASRRNKSPFADRHEVPGSDPGIDLFWSRDLLLLVLGQLLPRASRPSYARSRTHGEHLRRELQRLIDQPRIEVDVGVQLALDEVLVLQRDLLQLLSDLEQRVDPVTSKTSSQAFLMILARGS